MEELANDKTRESSKNLNSTADKLEMLPSTAQLRGLPPMAPVYRIPKDRKPFTYLSFYPKKIEPIPEPTYRYHSNVEKPTYRFSSTVNKPRSVDKTCSPPKTQAPMENSIPQTPLQLNFYRDNYDEILQNSLKGCPAVRPKTEEVLLETANGYVYVYTTWPEPKGYCPVYLFKKKYNLKI